MTVDGKITTRNFSPVDFTSREDKLHLFRQRALADAVLIGHTSLKRDNVRLSLPAELQQARIKAEQTPAPLRVIVSNKGRIDSRSENFSIRQLAHSRFFDDANASGRLKPRSQKKATLHLDRIGRCRSCRDVANFAQSIPCSDGRVRRRSDIVSIAFGTRSGRSTQSHHCSVHVRRSEGANLDRPEQGISTGQCALPLDRHAGCRRGVFPDLPNHASAAAPNRRLFATRSPHKFTSAVWTNSVHLLGAARAICAFVTANVCYSARCNHRSAFSAFTFQLQSHLVLYSAKTPPIIQYR